MKTQRMDQVCDELMQEISKVYHGTLGGVFHQDEAARLRAFWEIGRAISAAEQKNELSEMSRSQLMGRLGKLASQKYGRALCRTNMYHMRRFYAKYPTLQEKMPLTWTHYRTLISIEDDGQRQMLETRAAKEKLSHRAFEALVKQTVGFKKTATSKLESKLVTEKRVLNTYELVQGSDASWWLDVGFRTRTPLLQGEWSHPAGGQKVTLRGEGTRLSETTVTAVERFAYEASVVRVLDGSTLVLELRLHPRVVIHKSLRLRGVVVQNADTPLGEKALRFVRRRLKSGRRVVVHTYPALDYDSYVADVFYRREGDRLPDERDGILLNRELVVAGLAGLS